MNWWTEARFGLFIHWGVYAVAARHEWVKHQERLTDAQYQRYFDHFDPDLFDPREWAREARTAGMRYFVVTTKHHDLHDGSEVRMESTAPDTLTLTLPTVAPPVAVPVIELFLKAAV